MANGVKKINEYVMKDGRAIILTEKIDSSVIPGGTLFINPSTGELNYNSLNKDGKFNWIKFDPAIIFNKLSIVTDLYANSSIVTDKYRDLSITTPKLANDAVVTSKIKDLNITTAKYADSSVTTEKLNNSSVTTEKLCDYAVTNSKIKDSAIDSDKIQAKSIIDSNIADNTITNLKFARKTLENDKIKDKTLIESLYADKSVSTRALADQAVTSDKIALGNIINKHYGEKSISNNKLADNTITTEKINSINASKLLDNSITDSKYGKLSIPNSAYKTASISADKLDLNINTLLDTAIRVKNSQTIGNQTIAKTAWCKGSMTIKRPDRDADANLTVYGNIIAKGTVTATKCYNPVFADVAEAYFPIEKMEPGDPVCLCANGGLQIEKLKKDLSNINRFLGVVSDEYAMVLGASVEEIRNRKKVAVTLTGRIKIKLPGLKTKVGQFLHVSAKLGLGVYDQRDNDTIGRILENKEAADEFVLCQLWA